MPICPILFLIYINIIFFLVKIKLADVIFMLFVNNLGFLISNQSINKIKKLLKKIEKIALK